MDISIAVPLEILEAYAESRGYLSQIMGDDGKYSTNEVTLETFVSESFQQMAEDAFIEREMQVGQQTQRAGLLLQFGR